MKNFRDKEFKHLDKMDPEFLQFLDDVRTEAGVPFFLTSDARDWRTNKQVGGSSTSLHLYVHENKLVNQEERLASAVDFATPGSRARNKVLWREECWKIAEAVVLVSRSRETFGPEGETWSLPIYRRAVQLEYVQGPNDWHCHLALQPNGSPIKSKIILKQD